MINLTREEAQQVLDAVEYPGPSWFEARKPAAELLRAKLSEYPENFIDALKFHTAMQELEPEPVAWLCRQPDGMLADTVLSDKTCKLCFPVYTAPPQREWVGLTAQDLADVGPENYIGAIWADGRLREKNEN
jgi:hypothetical protein